MKLQQNCHGSVIWRTSPGVLTSFAEILQGLSVLQQKHFTEWCALCARSSWVLLPHVATRCRLCRVPPTLMGGGGRGGGSGATAAQTHSFGSTLPEETRIQSPTNVLLSSSGNKTSRAGVLPLCGSASAGLYSPSIAVQLSGYKFIQSRRTAEKWVRSRRYLSSFLALWCQRWLVILR